MSRITLSLPDELEKLLRREADRRRTSVSGIARRAIEAYLEPGRSKLPFAAIGRSGQRHTARNSEEILAGEWNDTGRR